MIWWVFGALLYGCFTFAVGCWWATRVRMCDLVLETDEERTQWIILHNPDGPLDVKWHDA